jgi:ABC-type nitrate/sulfonate/bicarbonate transport system ATPase subunit
MTDPVLAFDHVQRNFAGIGGRAPTHVLDPISFDVAAGKFTAVIGPSGCGKSTLLQGCRATESMYKASKIC